MPNLTVVTRDGEEFSVSATDGMTVLEAIQAADIDEIEALCGGACACATCHVYIGDQWVDNLDKRGDEESELLEFSDHYEKGSRLSCQIKMSPKLEGMKVTIAPEE